MLVKRLTVRQVVFSYSDVSYTYVSHTYPAMGRLLPAMGYGDAQIRDLAATIAKVPCDLVIVGTPRAIVTLRPERSTGMHEQHLDGSRHGTEQQQPGAALGHRPTTT